MVKKEDLWLFVNELGRAGTIIRLENLIKGLFTPKEIEELAERIRIIHLLKKGMGQHKIAEELQVGVATVGRGVKELKKGNFKYV